MKVFKSSHDQTLNTMAKFLTGNQLNFEIEELFRKAKSQIILISPYIKLHDRYASTLRTIMDNWQIEVIIVFGKNELDLSRSMKQEDFNFFKEFPFIEIRYEKRLHAKYYANESTAILTSMNLYNYSQDNNIEAGVKTSANLIGNIASSLIPIEEGFDNAAYRYFNTVIEQSELLFKKVPNVETSMLGFRESLKSTEIITDKLTHFFDNKNKFDSTTKKHYLDSEKHVNTNFVKDEPKIESYKIPTDSKYLSTTAISKELGLSSKDLFYKFEKLNWIQKDNENWILTKAGLSVGAQTKKGQYGEYIAWPSAIINLIK